MFIFRKIFAYVVNKWSYSWLKHSNKKVLVLEWDDRNDKLVFNVSNLWSTELFTVQLKISFQEVCKLYVDWDDVVNKMPPKWKSICEFLNLLQVIIDRRYYVHNVVFCEIGAFKNSFLNKVTGLMLVTLVKKRLWHKCFPVNFEKLLKITFFVEQLRWLDLKLFLKISVVGQSRKSHWCGLGLKIRNLKYHRGQSWCNT